MSFLSVQEGELFIVGHSTGYTIQVEGVSQGRNAALSASGQSERKGES